MTRKSVPYRGIAVLIVFSLCGGFAGYIHAQSDADLPAPLKKRDTPAFSYEKTRTSGNDPEEAPPYIFENQGVLTVEPDVSYGADTFKKRMLGAGYRDVWAMPLEVPIIDLDETGGGLRPIERGGGKQTTSLHLQGGDGHFYVLRSVNKSARLSLPEGFRGTFVNSIAQDQTSALNPVGALILPKLAMAAGILHTHPTLVIIPDSPTLGEYRDEFAGMLAQFERKPDEDQSKAARFGFSKNIVGTTRLIEQILEDNDNRVDERMYARARLFDMLISDWDRHEEQWRWAEFETEHGIRFVAVPKDRDFAFVKFDGPLNRLGRKTGNLILRRLVEFDEDIPDVLGLNWQGSKSDLRFTASLTRDDWIAIADSLRAALTDEVIEDAVRSWPDAVFDEIGPMTIHNLQSRRDQLPAVASDYYDLLAETVDIVGSDKHERFEVSRLSDDETRVVVHKTKKEGDIVRELYRRDFRHDETDELRLYGLDGNDQFIIAGEADDGILVRMIGGGGEDAFEDSSQIRGPGTLTRVYDTVEDTDAELGSEGKSYLSTNPQINAYELRRFERHSTSPIASFDYNSDDGLFLGGGIRHARSGFRKDPYAAVHDFVLNYAPRNRAYNVYYDGLLVDTWRGFDAHLEAEALAARDFRNFYGLGNETPESNRALFRAELRTVSAAPSLRRELGGGSYVEFGPRAEFISVAPPSGLQVDDPRVGFTEEDLVDTYFAGFQSAIALDSRDSTINTQAGFLWMAESEFNVGVGSTDERFARLSSEIRYYYTLPILSQLTLALRAGGATNFGTFMFYQANQLGGSDNLRGFRRSRFAGRSAAFGNAELRAKVLDFNIYLTRGELGVFGFVDQGRVWADDESSDIWHRGYGAGVWLTPFKLIVVTGSLGFSPEGRLFDLSIGFQY